MKWKRYRHVRFQRKIFLSNLFNNYILIFLLLAKSRICLHFSPLATSRICLQFSIFLLHTFLISGTRTPREEIQDLYWYELTGNTHNTSI